jgi:hypothetical protein
MRKSNERLAGRHRRLLRSYGEGPSGSNGKTPPRDRGGVFRDSAGGGLLPSTRTTTSNVLSSSSAAALLFSISSDRCQGWYWRWARWCRGQASPIRVVGIGESSVSGAAGGGRSACGTAPEARCRAFFSAVEARPVGPRRVSPKFPGGLVLGEKIAALALPLVT